VAAGIFADPDLTTFTRLDKLGLVVIGVCLEPGRAVLACRVVKPDGWCRRCGPGHVALYVGNGLAVDAIPGVGVREFRPSQSTMVMKSIVVCPHR